MLEVIKWGAQATRTYSKMIFIPAKNKMIESVQPAKIPLWCWWNKTWWSGKKKVISTIDNNEERESHIRKWNVHVNFEEERSVERMEKIY